MSRFQEQVENVGDLFIEDYQDCSLKFAMSTVENEPEVYVEELTGEDKISVLEGARNTSVSSFTQTKLPEQIFHFFSGRLLLRSVTVHRTRVDISPRFY